MRSKLNSQIRIGRRLAHFELPRRLGGRATPGNIRRRAQAVSVRSRKRKRAVTLPQVTLLDPARFL